MKKFILIDYEKGIFMGSLYTGVVFSGVDAMNVDKAYAFSSRVSAETYQKEFLNSEELDLSIHEVECSDEFISCVELIRQGYGAHVKKMFDAVPMISTRLH